MKYRNVFWTVLGVTVLSAVLSCKQIDIHEYQKVIPSNQWSRSESINGTFTVNDTVHLYNIYVVLRHRDAYEYNNIWLNIGLQPPGDSISFQKVNLTLGNDMNGWEGTGIGDIREVRKLISGKPRRFIKPGTYHYSIRHIMRDDPLKYVMNVGLRLEKVY
jgi:gliding motility-associated lipoprotein GldH